MKKLLFLFIVWQIALLSFSQTLTYDIRLNQVGFLPNAVKLGAIVNSQSDSFKVMTSDLSATVFRGQTLPSAVYVPSDEEIRIADLTLLQTPGEYVLIVDDLGKSMPFIIDKNVYVNLSKASIKAFYFNRASTPILSEYAGAYARAEGHPDTAIVVLPSAASADRPAGTIISTPGGWYDAGDYNKYVVNSGISLFTLLSAYETYPGYFDTLSTNIPESSNSIPDILDEALWNIKWMMTMQDTTDGGVYNKTTEAQFSDFKMPALITSTRYVCAKGTSATLDFAAIMAMTARIYKKYLPDLADQALKQSLKAYQWAKNNPDVEFNNPSASGIYPAVGTGGYGDSSFGDEFSWCASELYITTKDDNYYDEIGLDGSYDLPGWGNVKTLGLLSLIVNKDSLSSIADTSLVIQKLTDVVANTQNNIVNSAYRIPGDLFYWGGNNAYANWGMLFIQAFRQTKNANYFNAALSSLDYLLGRNATKYCFVTGTGTKNPKNIHHRISGSDGIVEPIPGLLVGGPNADDVSDCGASQYPSTFPAKSYADLLCSYSTNEIAINWNAPLAFLVGAIQSEYQSNYLDSMPRYLVISTRQVTLPYKKDVDYKIVFEGNTSWTLNSNENWITLSSTSGDGSSIVLVNSDEDNPFDTTRKGTIYLYNQGNLFDSILVTQNGLRKSFRIEAEEFVSMSGLQTETTSDDGGGKNIGYVDPGDWATYNIDITNEGLYDIEFRHAGYAADIEVLIDNNFVKNVTFPKTADWQVWDSYTTQMNLYEGQHEMKLSFNTSGVNLNWMQFDWAGELSDIENITENNIKVYPIPVDENLIIDFGSASVSGDIQILSVDGKLLINQIIKDYSKENINVSGLSAGIYFLKVNSGSEIKSIKIIIE